MNDDTAFQSDNLQRFIFDNAPVRGEWVHLQDSWQQVLARREYPLAIQKVLGEMMAAAALLAATVKMNGRLVLQVKATGPATLMMVECTSDDTLRAFAQWQEGDIAEDASLSELTGQGTLAITIEVDGAKQPYQGVVSLQGELIANVVETYFQQSEQLETRIYLAANDSVAAGLFVQQLPGEQKIEQEDEEHWSRISQLAATVKQQELLELGAGSLLHRLFNQEECRLLASTDLEFSCNCSRERVAETINLLGKQDAVELVEEQGNIEVACEFCNEHYRFELDDIMQIFSGSIIMESDSNMLH